MKASNLKDVLQVSWYGYASKMNNDFDLNEESSSIVFTENLQQFNLYGLR